MNKSSILFLGSLLALGMVACDDKLPVAPPQANEQGEVLEGFAGATASLSVNSLNLNTDRPADTDYINMYTVSAGSSGLSQSDIWGEFEISNSSDFRQSIVLSAYNGIVGTVNAAELYDAHLQLFGISPEAKTVYYRIPLYGNVEGNTYRIGSLNTFGAEGTYNESYDPGFFIDDTYYILGVEGWDPSEAVVMDHSEASPYDDPNFTYSFSCESTVYWKIVTPEIQDQVGDPSFDAGSDYWPFLYYGEPSGGNPLEGTLYQGDHDAPSVPAGEWTISINMKDFTYVVTGTPAMGAGDPTGIYLRGGMNDWGTPGAYQFIGTAEEGVFVIPYVTMEAGVEFKVADEGWSSVNLGGSGEGIMVGQEYALDGGDNISLTADFTGTVILRKSGSDYSLYLNPFTASTAGTQSGIYVRGGMNDWGADSAYEFVTTDYEGVWELPGQSIGKGIEFKVADSDWGAINYGANSSFDESTGNALGLIYNAGNISLEADFAGTLRLVLFGDAYYLYFVY